MRLPVAALVRPSSLRGRSNGALPADVLRSVTTPGGTATLVTPADRAWRALAAAAKDEAGHILVPYSSYRPLKRQEELFLARYRTAFKARTDTKQYQGKTWYLWSGHVTAAPGTSNHGLGLALDVRVVRGGRKVGIDGPAVSWLVANEHRFGFSHEIQSERWHIRYVAGDNPPAIVLGQSQELHQPKEDQETMTPELAAALAELRSELRAEIAAVRTRVDDRTGMVFNRIDARTGLIYNAVKGLDLGGPAADIDLDEVLTAIRALPAAVVAELTERLNDPA